MTQERVPDTGGMEPSPVIAQDLTSDQQLVADILRRDRKAAAQFVAQYSDAIYAYVRHRLSPRTDLVDDTVQDVFLAALGSLAQFRRTSSLQAFECGLRLLGRFAKRTSRRVNIPNSPYQQAVSEVPAPNQ